MKGIFSILLIALSPWALYGQSFTHVTYAPTTEIIPNPERGLYHQITHTDSEILDDYVADGFRLILINYDIGDFVNSPLSALFLRNLENDLTNVRNAGMKIIIRFAYAFQVTTPYGDAPPEIVLLHIQQLAPVLHANSDVIFAVQAGFIGTWGEWYYTDYFSESPGVITEQNWIDRKSVVDALLDVMPDDRMIQLRTPTFKRKMLEEDEFLPLMENEAYGGLPAARLGHHNDCFVANYTDYGTYDNVTVEKAYLAQDSKYVVVGGETCNPNSLSHCDNSLNELQRFHWTYLNKDYHPGVWSQWEDGGCATEIKKKLGYRYVLNGADLQNTANPGGHVAFTVDITNEGWANPTNPYKVEFILRNTDDQAEYIYRLADDLRLWTLNTSQTIDIDVGLPADMPAGDYEVYLAFKDKRTSLSYQPLYSIRFANDGIWEAEKGMNRLNHTLTVGDFGFPAYTGSDYFHRAGAITSGFEGPQAMAITQYNDNCIVYWTRDAAAENQVVRLQRSTDNVNFTTLAIKNNEDIAFIDKNLEQGVTYHYRVQYIDEDSYSEFTTAAITKNNSASREFLFTEIDGDDSDWRLVPPVITGYQTGMVSLKLANSATTLSFSIEAPTIDSYQLFFDTGQASFYKIENGNLYEKQGEDWQFIKTVETASASGFTEGSVLLSDIDYTSGVYLHGRLVLNGQDVWGENEYFYFLKYNVLTPPDNFKVKPSVVSPYSKVKVSWTLDSDLEGYMVERAEDDSEDFHVIADLGYASNYYLDDGLDSSIVYHYRMFSYSGIIRSGYTDIKTIDLANPTAIDDLESAKLSANLLPNPIHESGILRIKSGKRGDLRVRLFDADNRFLKTIYDGEISQSLEIPVVKGDLPAGNYQLVINFAGKIFTQKLLIF